MTAQRLGVTMPTRGAAVARAGDFAVAAEAAGLDSAWSYEAYRNPMILLAPGAMRTRGITLATGIVTALTRAPFDLANQAADIDELSGGRHVLGIGTGAPELVASFYDVETRRPLRPMREYVEVLRRAWGWLAGENVAPYEGRHHAFRPPERRPLGGRSVLRRSIPIYLAALGPRMTELAGEVADGWIGFAITPEYHRQIVRPRLDAGAARSSRTRDVQHVLQVVCSVSADREVALRRARIQVGLYAAHPMTDPVLAFHGLGEVQDEHRRRLRTEGPAALLRTSDALVELLSIAGTPEEARQRAAAYSDVTHLVFHIPYLPPLAQEESDDAFVQALAAFGSR